MDARASKLMRYYKVGSDDAQALVDAGLDTPRKARAGADKSNLPKRIKDKVKERGV